MTNYNIHQAVDNPNFDLFKSIVESDINLIDTVDDIYGRTPLIICSFKRSDTHFKIAKYLLDCGCDVNVQANYKWNNWSALMTSCYYGNTRMVELLINANANLELLDISSNSAWQLALENGNNDCVQMILNEMENKTIETRLLLEKQLQDAVFNNDYEETRLCLTRIDKENIKQVINSTTSGNHTLLYRACRNASPSIVNLLLEFGAIAKPHYYTKYSPLYIACHMGNIQIAQMILEKFPHLIQVQTIEKFLPFHAVCSQGHLEILRLLINFEPKPQNNRQQAIKAKIFTDASSNKYKCTFDLNSLDVNDQSGLCAAVLANRFNICEYLLELKFKRFKKPQKQTFNSQTSIPNAQSSHSLSILSASNEESSMNSSTSSFFDQLKNVFLDTKSYDPYIVNYSSTIPSLNEEEEDDDDQATSTEQQEDDSSNNSDEPTSDEFNPININNYSKFGSTCLHEAIRNRNYSITNLLIKYGANVNLPIYESIMSNESNANNLRIISNSICEAIKQSDEKIFLLLMEHFNYTDSDFNLALKSCLNELFNKNLNIKKFIGYLLYFKIINDLENKINMIKITGGIGTSTTPTAGLILNWNNLDLVQVYESYFFNAVRYYKKINSLRQASAAAGDASDTPQVQPIPEGPDLISYKKIHLHLVTRIDLTSNKLEQIPNCLFQIESLKYLKLSNNLITKLPLQKHADIDDINTFNQINLNWSCNQLEELDLDSNKLSELPDQLFNLKSLKHLNLSNNLIDKLPVCIWQAPALYDLNLSHNRLDQLPMNSCTMYSCIKELRSANTVPTRTRTFSNSLSSSKITSSNGRQTRRDEAPKRVQSVTDHPLRPETLNPEYPPSIPPSASLSDLILFNEKPIVKANFWNKHTNNGDSINDECMQLINEDELANEATSNANKLKMLKSTTTESFSNTQNMGSNRESKLIELNLSHNKFKKIPDCLSCITPKLIKLNLSHNKIVSLGAVCDLPHTLKFFDLSNNLIKDRRMRLINEGLLTFIIYYFNKYTSSTEQIQPGYFHNFLLENDFCYLNVINKLLNRPVQNLISSNHLQVHQHQQQSMQIQPQTPRGRFDSNTNSSVRSNSKRRTRSQSRNHSHRLSTAGAGAQQISSNESNIKRVLPPFDLFLINHKYNMFYTTSSSPTTNQPPVQTHTSALDSHNYLYKNEKLLLNQQNIKIFLEQLCRHKRHIKLDNLKSLNISNNKIRKLNLMYNLSRESNQENIIAGTSASSTQLPKEVVMSNETSSSDDDSDENPDECEYEDEDYVSSNSEPSSSSSSRSSSISQASNNIDNSGIKSSTPIIISNPSGKPKNNLKDKLSTLSPLKKKSSAPLSSSLLSSSPISKKKPNKSTNLNKSEKKALISSRLIYPNLTHLDVSSNRLKKLPGYLSYMPNLSYLNSSSNPELTRVSPRIGLLNKLWNFDLKQCTNLKDPVMLNDLVKQRTKTSDILGYLKSILEHSKPYTRIKLMFVGVQAIGKTSLLNRLREEGQSSQKSTWSERTTSGMSSSPSHINISTVGIDINEWVYDKPKQKNSSSSSSTSNQSLSSSLSNSSSISVLNQQQYFYIYQIENSLSGRSSFGPITFRTWDFAGQREYYTTHQYFISKRALYLVCWKLSEEEKGINEIHQWLSNIQTRAPGSPVIIVGTHQDQLAKLKNYKEISNYLQRIIYDRFVRPSSETETTSAYPPIMASIEISSKTGHNIKQLAKLIYDVAAQMKAPGSKDQLLLEQKIPVTYLALEECIYYVLNKLKSQSRNPILSTVNYLKEIRHAIDTLYPIQESGIQTPYPKQSKKSDLLNSKSSGKERILIRFRDDAEILQATQFLHENGILIHYNDVALNDLYFLDPQWLCDILATVVTIREINPFAAKGIMKINDLLILFKGSKFVESEEIMSFIVDLLGKFELALTWDNEHLLIPSLLPSEAMLKFSNQDIRVNIISKDRIGSIIPSNQLQQSDSISSLYSNIKLINSYAQASLSNKLNNIEYLYEIKPFGYGTPDESINKSIRRLYCLTYLPSGFFSRLITRILCDKILKECLLDLVEVSDETGNQDSINLISYLSQQEAEWKCWQTGIELKYLDNTLIRVKEIIHDPLIELNQNSSNPSNSDAFLANPVLYRDCENEFKIKSVSTSTASTNAASNASSLLSNSNLNATTSSAGCKFSFVECFCSFINYKLVKTDGTNETLCNINISRQISIKIFALIIEIIDSLLEDWYPDLGTRFMQDSKGDYLVTRLAPCNQCLTNKPAVVKPSQDTQGQLPVAFDNLNWIYCFMLDDICYSVLKNVNNNRLKCIRHGLCDAKEIAPDLAFEDIEDKFLISNSSLRIESLLGRGSFGSVYSGSLIIADMKKIKVAVKVLETFSNSNQNVNMHTESSNDSLNYRKSIRLSAKAYTIARQEISIINSVKHDNIVSMIGLSIQPLAIILELAPLGNLKDILIDEYKANMIKLSPFVIQQVCFQISSALVYLHTNRIIYRDLKADNVLVFKFPLVNTASKHIGIVNNENNNSNNAVYLKLADYSISRCVLPTGTKGFAGTPGFMAPEILKYNGEETYSEKVDCFSFGMLLYELITLKHPFDGQEQIKDIILNGGRPIIRQTDLLYPTLMLDIMCLCWLDNPMERPSSEQLLKYTNSYEFSHLLDCTILEDYELIYGVQQKPMVIVCVNNDEDDDDQEDEDLYEDENDDEDDEQVEEEDLIDLWVIRNNNNNDEDDESSAASSQFEILTYENKLNCTSRKLINISGNSRVECVCLYNNNQLWCIDTLKTIYVYCTRTYKKLNQYQISDPYLNRYNTDNSTTSIISMHAMEPMTQILMCTQNGFIIVLKLDKMHNLSLRNNKQNDLNLSDDNLNYFIHDVAIKINTSVLLPTRYDKNYDLWMGSDNGEIFSFSLKTMKLTGSYLHSSSHHYLNSVNNNSPMHGVRQSLSNISNNMTDYSNSETDAKSINVTIIKTTPNDTFFLWTYVSPGSTIFLWNHVSKKIMSAYNCKKAFDDLNFKPNQSLNNIRIVDITFLNGHLYCAINNGIVLVLKRLTLTPLLAFNAHMHQLYNLCPLTFETRLRTIHKNKITRTCTSSTIVKKTQHMLVSVGRALSPLHEDIYLSSSRYRIAALSKYASCLIFNTWNTSSI